jgi:hypothetical protein
MTKLPDDIEREAERVFDESRYETFSDHQEDIIHDLNVIRRAILAERERCSAAVASAIKEGMATIADELQNPSDETVEMGARAICKVEYGSEGSGWDNQIPAARAAITAVRGAFFSSESPDQT